MQLIQVSRLLPCLAINSSLTPTDSNESGRGRRARRADTNILVLKFNALTGLSHVHTGDAVVCTSASCAAILSHLSKLTDHPDPQKDEKVLYIVLINLHIWNQTPGEQKPLA